ncbi:hypothetical protein EYD45_11565 [Hyunsoonleella flava]|uniref:Uncharacterized protein n=1 Tax=Hyunsoonleella flava TaxID=2527939 RepID=A0A4Q9FCV1_9FLAO|nr:hypothetical protein [Hyunsoonleella flava]TBN02755.1 hypothetical protein EYD45_11565 [Hyunsoonleella flava]
MKRILLIISILVLLFSQSCSNRNDKIFSAYDELHSITLYEKGSEFQLLYNGVNTARGVYSLNNDTILLTYWEDQFKEFNPNEKLTRQILIDKELMRVESIDSKMHFCAKIDIDKRKIKKTSHNKG